MEKIFKKIISLTLILSFVFSPYLLAIQKVNAQSYNANGSYQYGNSFSSSSLGVSAYLTGLAPAISKLPLCRDKLGGAVKTLFNKTRSDGVGLSIDRVNTGSILGGNDKKNNSASSNISAGGSTGSGVGLSLKNGNTLNQKSDQGLYVNKSVSTYDANANSKLDGLDLKIKELKTKFTAVEENDTCIKSIGQLLVKELLKRLTVATVEWINTGGEGGPFYVKESQRFWTSIRNNEVLQFGYEISDPDKFPFGKRFLQKRVRAIQDGFAKNAEYSLDNLIQRTTPEFTAEKFSKDFSAGGWAAWTYLTQIPSNNPLGFELLASNELDKRLEGTEISAGLEIRQTLQQSGGFLNDVRCADPKNLSREKHNEAIRDGIQDPITGKIVGACKRWEAVTPGSLIAEAATETIHSTKDSLLQVDDLNGAVAAVIDAFFSKFTSGVAVNGYGGYASDGYYLSDDGLDIFGGKNQIENDFTDFQRNSEWIQNNPDFNIRTDLSQALIDEQRTFIQKMEEQNNVLFDLNKTIFQLDFCIPGPHPGWEQDSREILEGVQNTIPSKSAADFEDISAEQVITIAKSAGYVVGAVVAALIIGTKIGVAIGSIFPGAGNIIGGAIGALIGTIVGLIIDWVASPDEGEKLELYYSYIFRGMTAVKIEAGAGDDDGPAISSKEDITNAMDTMLERYTTLIRKYYITEWLPSVANESAREFNKTTGYFEIIIDNQDKILLMEGVSKRLGKLKENIDELNKQYGVTKDKPTSSDPAYEDALKPYISEFALLSKNLITGDDVAEVDSLMKEAREEIKYVYEDLLTGEYGCEKDLELQRKDPVKILEGKDLGNANKKALWTLKTTRRGEYPFTVWYDYNLLKDGESIPVPDDLINTYGLKRPTNKMPIYPGLPVNGGPGFLSNVIFDNSNDVGCEFQLNNPATAYWLDCLKVSDLFNNVDNFTITVARNFKNYPIKTGNDWEDLWRGYSFEQTIGIY